MADTCTIIEPESLLIKAGTSGTHATVSMRLNNRVDQGSERLSTSTLIRVGIKVDKGANGSGVIRLRHNSCWHSVKEVEHQHVSNRLYMFTLCPDKKRLYDNEKTRWKGRKLEQIGQGLCGHVGALKPRLSVTAISKPLSLLAKPHPYPSSISQWTNHRYTSLQAEPHPLFGLQPP